MTTDKQLVVFDFDWSMADQDSDRWVFEVLAPDLRRKMRDRPRAPAQTIQWTDLVAECLRELGKEERGIGQSELENALRQIPFHPAMKRAIQRLKEPTSLDTTIFILSNANTFFINTILEHQGIRNCIDTLITNPASFSPSDPSTLVLRRRIDPSSPPHGCQIGCEPNMCKGQELTHYLTHAPHTFTRTIYIGDGANDFCAVLRLTSSDVLLCRRARALERLVTTERARVKCTVEFWTGAWEVEEMLGRYARRDDALN